LSTRALASRIAIPSRRSLSSLLFLAVLMIATLFTWQRASHPVGNAGRPANASMKLPRIFADEGPSVFEQELAMSSHDLLHRWDPLIAEASKKTGVPAKWIRAVMNTESGGRTVLEDGPITSPVGAMGLMQVMPGTYAEMREEYDLGDDPYDPRNSIMAGAGYLRWLKSKFGFSGMFAAYNAGPGTFQEHLGGAALPAETVNYAVRIARFLGVAAPKMDSTGGKARGGLKLTRPDGSPLVVEVASVRAVRAPFDGEFADGVHAVLSIGKKKQGVREDVITASALIRRHGGSVAG